VLCVHRLSGVSGYDAVREIRGRARGGWRHLKIFNKIKYLHETVENAMTVDYASFTPLAALVGGALIGIAAAAFVLFNGRIAGISGILGGLFRPKAGDVSWRVAFVIGLMSAPLAYQAFAVMPVSLIVASDTLIIAAGLLVGVGTRYGAGCTSGHGVCGLSRFSLRSLVATLAFMAVGFVTVYIMRHVLGAA
jgi:uncharacterized protein